MAAFENPSAALSLAPLDIDVAKFVQQVARDTIPDMPDRFIAATTLRLGLPLITRDQGVRASTFSGFSEKTRLHVSARNTAELTRGVAQEIRKRSDRKTGSRR